MRAMPFASTRWASYKASACVPTPARRPLNAVLAVEHARDRYRISLGEFASDLERMLDTVIGPRH